MEKKYSQITRLWIIIGFSFLILLIFLTGLSGIYSSYKSNNYSKSQLEAIDSAREAQVAFQKQIKVWKTIVLEGDVFTSYRENAHQFSYLSDKVQDSLFNLKLLCAAYPEVKNEITTLIIEHKRITGSYIHLLVQLEANNFTNKLSIISLSKGKGDAALNQLDTIVKEIREQALIEIKKIHAYYYRVMLFFSGACTMLSVLLGIYISKKLFRSQSALEKIIAKRTEELVRTNQKITLSEEKYRHIVENSQDIVFSLDENFDFLMVNHSIETHLSIKPGKALSMNFLDLIYEDRKSKGNTKKLIQQKLDQFLKEKEALVFQVELISSIRSEPKEMNVSLELLHSHDKIEIQGKAWIGMDKAIYRFLQYERKKIVLRNLLVPAEDVSHQLTRGLHKYLDPNTVLMLRIALREIIINAIEHGNLNISFREKSHALKTGSYFELIRKRQEDPAYGDKKVTIDYILHEQQVTYRITDEGEGFDHAEILNSSMEDLNAQNHIHGRGILMSKNVFDRLEYNAKGNQVLLEKSFHPL